MATSPTTFFGQLFTNMKIRILISATSPTTVFGQLLHEATWKPKYNAPCNIIIIMIVLILTISY